MKCKDCCLYRDYNNISLDEIIEKINYKILNCVERNVNAGKLEDKFCLEELFMLQKAKEFFLDCADEIYEENLEETANCMQMNIEEMSNCIEMELAEFVKYLYEEIKKLNLKN